MKKIHIKKGFTLLEIIIVFAILGILATLGWSSFMTYNDAKAFETDIQAVLSMLEDARSKTLQFVDSSKYGVHFEASRVVLFKGNTYGENDPDNEEYLLRGNTLSPITLTGGGSDVVFERLNGKTNQSGTVTISSVSDPSRSKVITIRGTGIVEFD